MFPVKHFLQQIFKSTSRAFSREKSRTEVAFPVVWGRTLLFQDWAGAIQEKNFTHAGS